MPHTTAVNPGLGTLLQMMIASVQTTIAQRVSIEGPELAVGKADATHLDSLLKTDRPTLPDPGELTLKAWYDPQDPTHKAVFALVGAPAVTAFQLVFNDTSGGLPAHTTWAFNGFLTKFAPTGMEVESNLEVDVTIRLTSLPVETP